MSTHVATWNDAIDGRTKLETVRRGTLDESFMMLGLAVIGSVMAVCLIWLVA